MLPRWMPENANCNRSHAASPELVVANVAVLRYTPPVIVKLSSYKIFAIKLALFSATLAYLAGDLFLWQGLAWRTLHKGDMHTDAQPPMALVYGESITPAQLERYAAEQNWLRGRADCTPAERTSMLMDMVRSAILRIRARYNDKNLPDMTTAAQEEVQRLASRAKSDEEFDAWLASQGMTREEFTRRLAAAMKATAQLERAVQPLCQVTDEDVAKHYELLKDELVTSAHRPLRHIFISTLGENPADTKARAQAIMKALEDGADFAAMARRQSEDDHSAPAGGDLGEVFDDSLFPLPELKLFGDEPLPANQLALVQSRWGWHILLPGEIQPARRLALDEVRESLRTAIQSAQYELTTQSWFNEAIREAFSKKHLQINAN